MKWAESEVEAGGKVRHFAAVCCPEPVFVAGTATIFDWHCINHPYWYWANTYLLGCCRSLGIFRSERGSFNSLRGNSKIRLIGVGCRNDAETSQVDHLRRLENSGGVFWHDSLTNPIPTVEADLQLFVPFLLLTPVENRAGQKMTRGWCHKKFLCQSENWKRFHHQWAVADSAVGWLSGYDRSYRHHLSWVCLFWSYTPMKLQLVDQ